MRGLKNNESKLWFKKIVILHRYRVPMSLLRVFSVLIAAASSTSLVVVFRGLDSTLILDQSTEWLCHAYALQSVDVVSV